MAKLKGWKFPIQVDSNTGKIMTVEDNENIKQAVRVILETSQYERKIYPNFGTNVRSFMFEIVDPTMISDLKSSIMKSLKLWESHIKDINVSIKATQGTVSQVEVFIDYMTDIYPIQERVVKKLGEDEM